MSVSQELLSLLLRADQQKLNVYRPYRKQAEFHAMGAVKRERAFLAANQVGKTRSGAMEAAMHLTGRYPVWWQGYRFEHPIVMWAGGESTEATRDTVQAQLMGELGEWGTGTIPAEDVIKPVNSRGTAGFLDMVTIRHQSGGTSLLQFKTYEQGEEKWRGRSVHVIWLDEEAPYDIYSEAMARTTATRGIIYMTVTPIEGMTDVISFFYPEPGAAHRGYVMMDIEEAEHISREERTRMISSYKAHELEARTQGKPMLGAGKVYRVPESAFIVDSFEIPRHWAQIGGLDIGIDHPTACAWLAWDRDSDVVYLTHTYKRGDVEAAVHASAMRARGEWIPWAWPHDAGQRDNQNLEPIADFYRRQGLRMLPHHAKFPDGSWGVESGIHAIDERLQTGRFKVFSHLGNWFSEYELYHRDKKGKIVKQNDDLLDATRYALMMLRYARSNVKANLPRSYVGDYDPLHPARRGGESYLEIH